MYRLATCFWVSICLAPHRICRVRQNMARGTNAEIDYLVARNGVVLPIEVKASTRGSMQSLWLFMRKKGLHNAIRTSLENFGKFEYVDNEAHDDVRHVDIVPLYALSNL